VRALPEGTVTFLFTDVEGSTRLLGELGRESYAKVLAQHHAVLRAAVATHGGVEVDTQGDACFVAFPTASGALAAAAEAQAALAAGPVRVRMGIHTGEPLRTPEGYIGMDVHRAARIAAAGHGGQVLVSKATRALVAGDGLRDLGPHRLKDLSAPERLYQLGEGEFPPPRSLYRTNLPVPATAFLGRDHELAEVVELLGRDDVRLVTLTGPGGAGKTRLALQAAAELADRYPEGGVTWVPLSVLQDPALVLPTVAAARDLQLTGDRGPVEAVAAELAGRRTLLLLDNIEQVIGAARDIAALIARAPTVDVLVTSREPLAVAAEHEYPVGSLASKDAVALFVERAVAVRPDFRGGPAVAELCERLDRLPLAIELAAARTRSLSPSALLARLGRRLDLLKAGRDADPRQQTLRATIAWSHDLLDGDERELFANLAVFAGGCTLEDAELVCDADVETLGALVEKSLLRRRIDQDGGDRYLMLETIREFAAERLGELSNRAALRDRHANRYLHVAEDTFAAILSGGSSKGEFERFTADEGNLRAALVTLRGQPDAEAFGRLCAALFFHWYFRGDPREGREWTRAALENDLSEQTRAALENVCSALLYLTGGDSEEALALAESSVERCRRLGDDRGLVFGLDTLGNIIGAMVGDLVAGLAAYEEAFRISLERGEPWWERTLASNIGLAHAAAGRLLEAREYLARARACAGEAGDEVAHARDTVNVALVEAELGNWPGARAAIAEGLAAAHELGLRLWVSSGLLVAARVAASAGSPRRGARLLGAAQALRETMGLGLDMIDARVQRQAEEALREVLGDSFDAALREGAAGSLDEAVALALSGSAAVSS
jgi:predicted ATPase/class 3 adenylate cyclase